VTAYTKPHLAFADQLDLLKSRGLIVDDETEAEHLLRAIGYYRLSGYWYSYRRRLQGPHRDDLFVEGTTFRQVVRLYDADRRLKLHVLDALERIEIGVRVLIGFTLGRRGSYAYLSAANLDGRFTQSSGGRPSTCTYDRWLRKMLAAQTRSSEDFVLHFQHKYDGRLPVWVMTEILDFGSMSYLFQGLKASDRNEIAARLDILDRHSDGNGGALANWLRVLSTTFAISAPTTLDCGTGTSSIRSRRAICARSRICVIWPIVRCHTSGSTRHCASSPSCWPASAKNRSGRRRSVD
jgi:abortive infection bacteriophage resistance protein